MKIRKLKSFSLVEVILAISIFVIISIFSIETILYSMTSHRLAEEYAQAEFYAQEGIEASRSIRNQNWSNITSGTFGLTKTNGFWQFQSNPETLGKFTRIIKIDPVNRIGNQIVENGGTIDPYTYKITSIISWNFSPLRQNTIEKITYLTYFKKPIIGNWSIIAKQSGINLPGNQQGIKVIANANYAFVITNATTNNFYVINISNLNSPVIVATLTLPATLKNITFDGNYVYVSSTNDNQEMTIVNVTNPNNPTIVSYFNAPGVNDGLGIAYFNNFVFLGRTLNTSQNELLKINVANRSSPSLVASLNTDSNINEIVSVPSYLFATSNKTSTRSIISIHQDNFNILHSLNSSLNLSYTTIIGNLQNIYVGTSNRFITIINSSNPQQLQLITNFSLSSSSIIVNDIDINNNNNLLFIGTNDTANEFKVVNVSNKSSPSILGQFNLPNAINGIDYIDEIDRVIAVTANTNEEFIILKPQ